MMHNAREKLLRSRSRIIPAVIALSLMSVIAVSVLSTSNAQANPSAACAAGYSGAACGNPHASRVVGSALVGSSVKLTIVGVGFYGKPKITSNDAGTTVAILHVSNTSLLVKVNTPFGSRVGEHTLTIRLANGKSFKVNYSVK
jgi:hypothetical protein